MCGRWVVWRGRIACGPVAAVGPRLVGRAAGRSGTGPYDNPGLDGGAG